MLKSCASKPSTSRPSWSFTVTGTLMKLTFTSSLKSSSKSLPGVFEPWPLGIVLMPCDPGGGACGLVAPCDESLPGRVFPDDGGLLLGAAVSLLSLVPGTGAVTSGVGAGAGGGALFCGLGASGNGCCAAANGAARQTAASRMAQEAQLRHPRVNMVRWLVSKEAGTQPQYNRKGRVVASPRYRPTRLQYN